MKNKLLIGLAILTISVSPSATASGLFDGGFESPVTYDGPPFVGSWEAFVGGGAVSGNSALFPRTGAQSLGISINNTVNTFAGAFQDVPITAGLSYTWGGWHATTSSPLDVGAEARIEWRNSGSNTEVGRTPNLTPIPTLNAYSAWSLTATAPAGADTARVVYAIQSFSTNPLGNGTVYLDDVYIVPEPTVMTLLGLGSLALVALRRTRA